MAIINGSLNLAARISSGCLTSRYRFHVIARSAGRPAGADGPRKIRERNAENYQRISGGHIADYRSRLSRERIERGRTAKKSNGRRNRARWRSSKSIQSRALDSTRFRLSDDIARGRVRNEIIARR